MDPQLRQAIADAMAQARDSQDTAAWQTLQSWLNSGTPPTDPRVIGMVRQAAQTRGTQVALPAGPVPPVTPTVAGLNTPVPDPVSGLPGGTQGGGARDNNTTTAQVSGAPSVAPVVPPGGGQGGGAQGGQRDDRTTTAQVSGAPATESVQNTNWAGGVADSPIDPYVSASQGKGDALNAVLAHVLKGLGVDINDPGIFTNDVASQISPYLPLYMATAGLDNSRKAAGDFQTMMHGPGGFGRLQNWAQGQVADSAGKMKDMGNAEGKALFEGLLQALTAGDSSISQMATQGAMKKIQGGYTEAGLQDPNLHYLDYLKQNQVGNPMLTKLLPLFGNR